MPTNKTSKIPETLIWKAPSQERRDRTTGWYLGFALISLGLLAFAIYDKSVITVILFVLIIGIIYLLGLQSARDIQVRLGKTGITAGQTTYPYKTIKTFWIVYSPPDVKTLNFETTAYLNSKMTIQLGNQDPMLVKLFLGQYLPEDLSREESLSEVLARRLKI